MMQTLFFYNRKARFILILNLVFLVFAGCTNSSNTVAIEWEGNKATGLIIPKSLLSGIEQDSLAAWLQVQRANAGTRMLGEYDIQGNDVVFKPLIPFTRGFKYEVSWRNKLLTAIQIPADENRVNPKVVSVYPTGKSLPENLLKIYIVFSKPMQEGKAVENIAVIKNGADTVSSVFLNLEPELWNKERTILTVWLDPGRIKRELQPNQSLGPPLEIGNRYEIIIKPGWADKEGAALGEYYRKEFVVIKRDDRSPDLDTWTIHPPAAGTVEPLRIELHESLDYGVLINAVHIIHGQTLKGTFETLDEETVLLFTPSAAWEAGQYTIVAEPRLEDLAGNNLDRLFDTDLLADTTKRMIRIHTKQFLIK